MIKKSYRRLIKATGFILVTVLLAVSTALAGNLVQSSVYSIDRTNNILKDISAGTSAAQLKNNLENDLSCVKVCLQDGTEYTGDAVATGMSVNLYANGTIEDALQISVCGDASGDGQISIIDYTLARLDILGLKSLDSVYQTAADINQDGQISIIDYTLIRLHILGLKSIVPGTNAQPLSGCVIGIDAGHQSKSNADLEPVSPGGTEFKKKVSSGTQGRFTGVPEYVINLQVALKLKEKLESLGATVVMTRETNDVDISNAERAVMMNNSNVDCWLRIHADGSNDPTVNGISILVPADGCMNTTDPTVVQKSTQIAESLLSNTVATTGAKNNGLSVRSDQTGFCWSAVPVCTIEMGYMTNEQEDRLLVTDAYQEKIVEGLANGFIAYFSN